MPAGDDRHENQSHAPENDRSERPQYHHDAEHGETRYPPASGSQHSGRPGHSDPHSALNEPVADIEAAAELQRVGLGDNVPEAETTGGVEEAGEGEADASSSEDVQRA